MKNVAFLMIFITAFCNQCCFSMDFRVCLLCDTSNSELKTYHEADLNRMEATVKSIAAQCAFKSSITILKGMNLAKQDLDKWISKIPAKSVVLVYYTGGEKEFNSPDNWLQCSLAIRIL